MIALGLLIGFVVIGPVVCWLLGVFNPIGYMGVFPWNVPDDAWRK
jgi:hypothetical protein